MRVLPIALVVVLSGCIGWPDVREGEAPVGASADVMMVAIDAFVGHGGSGNVEVVPDSGGEQPKRCILYRNNVSYRADSCRVVPGAPKHHDVQVEWHIFAAWERSDAGADDTYRRLHEKSIWGFHDAGRPYVFWNGTAKHEDFGMAVE